MAAVILGPEEKKCTKWLIIVFTKFERKDSFATNLTLSQPNLAKGKFRPNFQISFCEILKNK